MKDEYEEGYANGETSERFDWTYALNEEFGWNVNSIKDTITMIKKVWPNWEEES